MRFAPLLALFLAATSFAQESFAPRFEDGDVWIETTRASLNLRLKVTQVEDGVEGSTQAQDSLVEREERREVTILEGGKNAPAAWKVSWPASRVREGAEAQPTELEGKSVEVRGREALPEDASEASKAAAREPGAWRSLLPPGPKSPGDSWKLKPASLLKLLIQGAREEPADSPELDLKFAGVEEKDGARIATIEISGPIAVDSRQEFRIEYAVKGTLRWDLTTGHPVSLELRGEAKAFEGKVKDAHGEVVGKIEGKGSEFGVRVEYSVK